MESNFRINSKNVLLTYPRSEFSRDELYNFINDKYPLEKAIICTEKHQDGGLHLHALLQFKKKIDIRNEKTFDFKERHPNMESVRNINASINYVKKGGEYQEWTNSVEEEYNPYDMATTMNDRKEFFKKCFKRKIPFQYAQDAWRQEEGIDSTIYDRLELPIPNPLLTILKIPETKEGPLKSTIIIGPSGCGKTNWALKNAELPTLVISHMDDLKKFKPRVHKSLIFDDMDFKHTPRTAQIHIVDNALPRSIHVRYGVVQLPAGLQKIFTTNQEIFIDDIAINRRVNKINLY